MLVNPKIFKTYDIRALYPEEINEEVFPDIISGIYTFFVQRMKKNSLAVGLSMDMRLSSPALYGIAKKYNVSVDEIKEWNQLSSNELQLGQPHAPP